MEGRNTLYGKNSKYCKTPTFDYFHGGKKICSQNQSAEKILYEKILKKKLKNIFFNYIFNWLDKFTPGRIVSALRAWTIAPTLSLRLRLSLRF